MPALLASDEEIAMWLGELGTSDAELMALLRPYEGELVMREQDGPKSKGNKPPPKPKKPKRHATRGYQNALLSLYRCASAVVM
jgi:hypothetical protein